MTGHTAGPWKCVENGLAGYGDNGRNFEIQSAEGEPIAEHFLVHRLIDDGKTKRYKRAKADARLIASAPDLLVALEEIARDLRGPSDFCADKSARATIQFVLETARAAIAMATKGE